MSGRWNKREDENETYELELDYEGHRYQELSRIPFRCQIVVRKAPLPDDWFVSIYDFVTLGLARGTIDAAQEQALALVGQWADALGAAIVCHGRPVEWPLRPVRCAWCDYVGHDCGGGARDPESDEPYVPRNGDDVACSVWRGSGTTRELRDLEGPRLFTFDTDTWFVQGHYGSGHFDMALYRFVKNLPSEPADPVCDSCVQKRIDAGDLELVTEHAL
jgi:hypothetical protein